MNVNHSWRATAIAGLVVACCIASAAHTLSVQQIDWGAATGGYLVQNSDWGTVTIRFQPGDEKEFVAGPGGLSGYLQVVTFSGTGTPAYNWAVSNMLIVIPSSSTLDERLPDSFTFNIGLPRGFDASIDTVYSAGMVITATPLTEMPNIPLVQVAVTHVTWVWSNGLAGQVEPPPAQNFVAFADDNNEKFESKIKIKETDVEAVNEELNGCGPGAAARSLKYLQKQGLINLNQTVQQVYDTLKGANYMMTDLGVNGKGTTNANFQAGKDKYSQNRNLKIETDATATSPFIKSDVMDAMNAGADVEIVFDKGKNDKDQDMLGHIAFVSEIILTRDKKTEDVTSFKVKFIDDPNQGNGKAENRLNGNWLEFTVTRGSDQKEKIDLKGWGKGATLTQFFVEAVKK